MGSFSNLFFSKEKFSKKYVTLYWICLRLFSCENRQKPFVFYLKISHNTFMHRISTLIILSLCCTIFLVSSSCAQLKKNTGNNNLEIVKTNSSKDSVVLPKDSTKIASLDPVEFQIDTIVWVDTLIENSIKQTVIRYTKIGTNPIHRDTLSVVDLSATIEELMEKQLRDVRVKPIYNVAVILPFMTNLFSGRSEIPGQSIRAIEFYEGIKIALDSLKREGVNLNVNVFDSQKDQEGLDRVLEKMEGTEWDLIIAHTSTDVLKVLAEYGKKHQIPVVSAFNNNNSIAEANHFYIQVNSGFEVHSRHIANFINGNIKMPSQTGLKKINYLLLGMSEDSLKMEMIQEAYSLSKNEPSARLPQMIGNEAISIGVLQKYFARDALNVVVIPSDKSEIFVFSCLREISSLYNKIEPRNSYQFLVIGSSQWKYFERVNYEYYNNLHLHFTDEFFINKEDRKIKQFEEGYRQIYGIAPREFAYIGFDIMLYFGRMLKKHGTAFPDKLIDEPQALRHTRFEIEPVYEKTQTLDSAAIKVQNRISRFENQYLNIIQFSEYDFKLINLEKQRP